MHGLAPLVAAIIVGTILPSLPLKAQQQPNPGQELYSLHCAACHGAFGEGSSAPDLANPRWLAGVSDADLDRIIRDGVPQTGMRGFSGRLTTHEMWNIVNYLRTLRARDRIG